MEQTSMKCARCSIEKGILYLDFNGDYLCKECYIYCKNKLKNIIWGVLKMKYFVSDKCPFCNKDYIIELGLETVGDVLEHDKICDKNPNKK